MKRAVRTLVLVVAVACTCLAVAAPIVVTTQDAPMPLCHRQIC
jgi:hypothetical protein